MPMLCALMPILRGAVTFSRFRAEPVGRVPRDSNQWLARGLKLRAFTPIDRKGDVDRSAGFVELEAQDSVEFSPGSFMQGEHLVVSWRVDQLKVSSAQVRAELEAWKTAFELDKGRPPGRVERAEARLAVRQELRNAATPSSRTVDVSWNLKTSSVELWTVSRKLVDEIADAFGKAFDTRLIPQTPPAMAEAIGIPDSSLKPTPELSWVEEQEADDGQA